jgi:predicted N-acetyltransferase YhbS
MNDECHKHKTVCDTPLHARPRAQVLQTEMSHFAELKLRLVVVNEPCDDWDERLRKILTTCFVRQAKFATQRFNNEMPRRRWMLLDESDSICAHVATHEKSFLLNGGASHKYVGIAEVCVLPEHRRKGIVKSLLALVHEYYQQEQGFEYSVLMGEPEIYSSSGYVKSGGNIYLSEHDEQPARHPMIRVLQSSVTVPTDRINLNCASF